MSFEQELGQYKLHLPDLLGHDDENQGKFVVIRGDDIQGIYDTYELALQAAYDRNGLAGFFVKKIERNETVMFFSRNLK